MREALKRKGWIKPGGNSSTAEQGAAEEGAPS
jgi:hypothetical protein